MESSLKPFAILKYTSWLGSTIFGGPPAHIAVFHKEFVDRLHWVSDDDFSQFFALAQGLPGPASTQLLFTILLAVGGSAFSMAGFIGWSAPGWLLMTGMAIAVILTTPSSNVPQWMV